MLSSVHNIVLQLVIKGQTARWQMISSWKNVAEQGKGSAIVMVMVSLVFWLGVCRSRNLNWHPVQINCSAFSQVLCQMFKTGKDVHSSVLPLGFEYASLLWMDGWMDRYEEDCLLLNLLALCKRVSVITQVRVVKQIAMLRLLLAYIEISCYTEIKSWLENKKMVK